jgi:hypothetical protein
MKHRNSRWVMGTAIGLATIAVAIDHTRHKVPEAQPPAYNQEQETGVGESPCSLTSPCALTSPCSLNSSPCSMD